jgi:hypothetical protein
MTDQHKPAGNEHPAKKFLRQLDPNAERFTFQTFDDAPDREMKNKKLAKIFHGTFDEYADALARLNDAYAGIFVAINETDGAGRSKRNVTHVRALMLDLDGAPLDPVRQCAMKPHLIIETSAGHHHVFYLVEGMRLDEYEDAQRGLAKRFDGDPNVATLERCTRLRLASRPFSVFGKPPIREPI